MKQRRKRSEMGAGEAAEGSQGALAPAPAESTPAPPPAPSSAALVQTGETPVAKGYDFGSVQRTTRATSPLRPDLRQIVETHWIEDLQAAWMRVRGALKVGEKRSHHGHLHAALDEAREISQEAHGLFVTASLEAERWEKANDVTFAAMWSEASRACEHERKEGTRSKNITDTDVRAKCATLFPDEWLAQEHDRTKVKLTVERMKQLAKDASEKCEDIRVMLQKLRG